MTKPALLLLHGALGSHLQFNELIPLLDHHYDVHTFSFSGHGNNGLAESCSFTMPMFVDDVIQYMDVNNLQSIDVFGYSMGGYVALYMSLLHPHRTGKIYTLGTKISWSTDYAEKEIKKLDPDIIEAKVPAFAHELELRHPGIGWRKVLALTKKMMLGLGKNNYLSLDELKNIKSQVRISQGDRDNTLTLEESVLVYYTLPSPQLEILPNTQHPFEKVNIERLAEGIMQYFGS